AVKVKPASSVTRAHRAQSLRTCYNTIKLDNTIKLGFCREPTGSRAWLLLAWVRSSWALLPDIHFPAREAPRCLANQRPLFKHGKAYLAIPHPWPSCSLRGTLLSDRLRQRVPWP